VNPLDAVCRATSVADFENDAVGQFDSAAWLLLPSSAMWRFVLHSPRDFAHRLCDLIDGFWSECDWFVF